MSGFEVAAGLLTTYATEIALAGTALSAAGAVTGGIAQSNQMKAQADAQEARAAEERAVAQREALRRRKEADLVMSRQQAVAAASGGSATDPTVLDLMGDTAAQGDVNSRTAIAEGETRGRALEYDAAISRMGARQATLAGLISGGSTMLTGFSEFAKYRPRQLPSLSAGYTYS